MSALKQQQRRHCWCHVGHNTVICFFEKRWAKNQWGLGKVSNMAHPLDTT